MPYVEVFLVDFIGNTCRSNICTVQYLDISLCLLALFEAKLP